MNMPAGEFKAKRLKLMEGEKKKGPFGFLKDSVRIKGDIVAPTGSFRGFLKGMKVGSVREKRDRL